MSSDISSPAPSSSPKPVDSIDEMHQFLSEDQIGANVP